MWSSYETVDGIGEALEALDRDVGTGGEEGAGEQMHAREEPPAAAARPDQHVTNGRARGQSDVAQRAQGAIDLLYDATMLLACDPEGSGPRESLESLSQLLAMDEEGARLAEELRGAEHVRDEALGLATAIACQLLQNERRQVTCSKLLQKSGRGRPSHQRELAGQWLECTAILGLAMAPLFEPFWQAVFQELITGFSERDLEAGGAGSSLMQQQQGAPDLKRLSFACEFWKGLPMFDEIVSSMAAASKATGRRGCMHVFTGGSRFSKGEVYVGEWRIGAKYMLPRIFCYAAVVRGAHVPREALQELETTTWCLVSDATSLFSCIFDLLQLPDFLALVERDDAEAEACSRASELVAAVAAEFNTGLATPFALVLEAAVEKAATLLGPGQPCFKDEGLVRIARVLGRTSFEGDAVTAVAAFAATLKKKDIVACLAIVRAMFPERVESLAASMASLVTSENDCPQSLRLEAIKAVAEIFKDKDQGRAPRHTRHGFDHRGLDVGAALASTTAPPSGWESEALRSNALERVLSCGLFDSTATVRRAVVETFCPAAAAPPGSDGERRLVHFLFMKVRDVDAKTRAAACKALFTRFPVEDCLMAYLQPADWRVVFEVCLSSRPEDSSQEQVHIKEAAEKLLAEYLEPVDGGGISLARLDQVQESLLMVGYDQDALRALLSKSFCGRRGG